MLLASAYKKTSLIVIKIIGHAWCWSFCSWSSMLILLLCLINLHGWVHNLVLHDILTLWLLGVAFSADRFCKQSGSRSGLIWMQSVWHSDNIHERFFLKTWFWNNSADDKQSCKVGKELVADLFKFLFSGLFSCADPVSYVRGSNFDNIFLMRGGRIKIPLSAGHHRPASETPFKWRFAGEPIMA